MKLMRYINLLILIFVIGFVSNSYLLAQSFSSAPTGKLTGLILDVNDALIIAAKITVEGKGFKRGIMSAEDGSFEIELPEGKYKIKVEHNHFYPSKKKTVRIRSNVTTKLDIKLKAGKRVDESHP